MQTRLVGNVHLVRGNADSVEALLALLEGEGVAVRANPDVHVRKYQGFGIDDAIELRDRSSRRPVGGLRRIFIIVTSGMTREAQNALLKTLEEPSADAMFFFVVPAPETLLLTLRSRAQTLVLPNVREEKVLVDVGKFLAATGEKRLDMLKPLLEKDADDKRDMGAIVGFLSSLERTLTKKPEALRAVYRARKYIGDRGALVKPLLEQVALLVPKV